MAATEAELDTVKGLAEAHDSAWRQSRSSETVLAEYESTFGNFYQEPVPHADAVWELTSGNMKLDWSIREIVSKQNHARVDRLASYLEAYRSAGASVAKEENI